MEEVGDISVFNRELSKNAINSSYQHIKKFQDRLLNDAGLHVLYLKTYAKS